MNTLFLVLVVVHLSVLSQLTHTNAKKDISTKIRMPLLDSPPSEPWETLDPTASSIVKIGKYAVEAQNSLNPSEAKIKFVRNLAARSRAYSGTVGLNKEYDLLIAGSTSKGPHHYRALVGWYSEDGSTRLINFHIKF